MPMLMYTYIQNIRAPRKKKTRNIAIIPNFGIGNHCVFCGDMTQFILQSPVDGYISRCGDAT